MTPISRWYYAAVPAIAFIVIVWSLCSTPSWTGILSIDQGRWSSEPASNEFKWTAPAEEDTSCRTFQHHRLAEIQVVLKVGATQPIDQVLSHVNSITNCVSNMIIVSDKEEPISPSFQPAHDIISDLPEVYWDEENVDLQAHERINSMNGLKEPATERDGWLLDRFKFLPMMEYAYERNEAARWFFFVEADTYIVWDTLFRLLDRYDARKEWYIGSPSPGREMDDGKKTYFAYGGTGILLSNPAIKNFVHRTRDHVHGNFTEPSITEKWAQLAKDDCCGDSVLGFALANQGIFLSGLYPMFNPHPLHGIPFGPSAKPYWCQPVLTLHKSWPRAVGPLSKYLNSRPKDLPVLYADILDYLSLANITEERQHWQNSDWAGFEEGPESPVHIDTSACAQGCHTHSECFQWTFFSKSSWGKEPSERKCTFVRSIRLGSPKDSEVTLTSRSVWTSGWDVVKVKGWVNGVECADAEWVEPSIDRIY